MKSEIKIKKLRQKEKLDEPSVKKNIQNIYQTSSTLSGGVALVFCNSKDREKMRHYIFRHVCKMKNNLLTEA